MSPSLSIVPLVLSQGRQPKEASFENAIFHNVAGILNS